MKGHLLGHRSTIEFAIGTIVWPRGEMYPAIEPLVDGTNLVQLVQEFEESHGIFVGCYGGVDPQDPSASPIGAYGIDPAPGPDPDDDDPGKVTILGCQCGIADDQPLLCESFVDDEIVEWRNFSNPFRDESYDGFGPFVFDRNQYDAALASLARSLRSWRNRR